MEPPKIHDITPPGGFLPEPSSLWWLWVIIALICLAGITFLILFLRKPNLEQQHASLLDEARSQLENLKGEAPILEPQTLATRISLIIRHYLTSAFDDTTLFETNQEFTLRPHALEKLHTDSRESVKSYLTKLSELKYTPTHSDGTDQLIDEAEALLTHIERHIASPEA